MTGKWACPLCGCDAEGSGYVWLAPGGLRLCEACRDRLWRTFNALTGLNTSCDEYGVSLEWHMLDDLLRRLQHDPLTLVNKLTLTLTDRELRVAG